MSVENKLGLDFSKDEEGFTLIINSPGWEVLQSGVTKPIHPHLTHTKLSHPDYGIIQITYLSPKQTSTEDNQKVKT